MQARATTYAGPMLTAPRALSTATQEVGGRTDHVEQYDVTLPAGTSVEIGNLVTLTDAPTDPSLTDVEFTRRRPRPVGRGPLLPSRAAHMTGVNVTPGPSFRPEQGTKVRNPSVSQPAGPAPNTTSEK